MNVSFFVLLFCAIALTIFSVFYFFSISGIISTENEWDGVSHRFLYEVLTHDGKISAQLNDATVKSINELLDRTQRQPFIDRNAVERIGLLIAEYEKTPITVDELLNIQNQARSLLANSEKTMLLLIEITIIFLVSTAIFVFMFYLSPQNKFVKTVETISGDLSRMKNDETLRERTSSFREAEGLINSYNGMLRWFSVYRSILRMSERSNSLNDMIDELRRDLKKFIDFNSLSFAGIDGPTVVSEAAYTESKTPKMQIPFSIDISQTILESLGNSKSPFIISDLEKFSELHPEYEDVKLVLGSGMKSSVIFPIYVRDRKIGFFFLDSFKKNAFGKEDTEGLELLQTIFSMTYQKTTLTKDFITNTSLAFAQLVGKKDVETGMHLSRMAAYSKAIAEELARNPDFSGMTPEYVERIHEQAPLHDIGKVAIAEKILLKPGKLTDKEFEP